MDEFESRSHSEVSAQGSLRRAAQAFGEVFRKLAEHRESRVEEGQTAIRDYIKNRDKEDQRLDQLNPWR